MKFDAKSVHPLGQDVPVKNIMAPAGTIYIGAPLTMTVLIASVRYPAVLTETALLVALKVEIPKTPLLEERSQAGQEAGAV